MTADQHHHDTGDDLSSPVSRHGALTDQWREVDPADIADAHGHAVLASLDQHVADLLEAMNSTLPADEELLSGANEIPAAGGRVVALEGDEELAERDIERTQPVGQYFDLVGLQLSAKGVDLDDAGDATDLIGDKPIENDA